MRTSRRQVLIENDAGLHLRAADKFVNLARQFRAEVRVRFGDATANGRSILDLMSLAAAAGSSLELEATGIDADQALDALGGLIASRFHEACPCSDKILSDELLPLRQRPAIGQSSRGERDSTQKSLPGRRAIMNNAALGRKLLIIEDEADTANSLAMLMRLRGHQVGVARSGPDGLKAALEARPEIILLDLGLPSLSGYEVASHLRATGEFEDVLIVAISGYGRRSDRDRSSAAGIDHHLVKPVSQTDLEALIQTGKRTYARPLGD